MNAAAHIQHHYFFNSLPIKEKIDLRNPAWYLSEIDDPFGDMLTVYDDIVGEYLTLKDTEVIIVTGLSQKPYDRIKYYYRLKDHGDFLKKIEIQYRNVIPRMTRDFLIEFDSSNHAIVAQDKLRKLVVESDGEQFFADIDNRGDSLFVTLTYPYEINDETMLVADGIRVKVKHCIAFVAIKNGMHQEDGFAFFTPGAANFAPVDRSHVKKIHESVIRFFGLSY